MLLLVSLASQTGRSSKHKVLLLSPWSRTLWPSPRTQLSASWLSLSLSHWETWHSTPSLSFPFLFQIPDFPCCKHSCYEWLIRLKNKQTNNKQTNDILTEGRWAQGTTNVILEFHIEGFEVRSDEACCQQGSPTLTDESGCGQHFYTGSWSYLAHEMFEGQWNPVLCFLHPYHHFWKIWLHVLYSILGRINNTPEQTGQARAEKFPPF